MRPTLLACAIFTSVLMGAWAGEPKKDELTVRFEASSKEAARLYPDATKPGTAFYNFVAQFDQMLRRTNDPLFNNPDKPLIIAKQVAAWLAAGYPAPATAIYTPPRKPQATVPRGYPAPRQTQKEQLKALGYDDADEKAGGATLILPMGGGNYITSDGKAYNVSGNVVRPLNP